MQQDLNMLIYLDFSENAESDLSSLPYIHFGDINCL